MVWWKSAERGWQHLKSYQDIRAEITNLSFLTAFPATIFSNVLLAVFLAIALWGNISAGRLSSWLTLLSASLLFSLALAIIYHNTRSTETVRWLKRFRLSVFMSGMAWGLAALMLFPAGDVMGQLVLLSTIIVITAGAAIVYAFDIPAATGFVLPASGLLFFRIITENNRLTLTMAGIIILYYCFLIYTIRRGHLAFQENIRLRVNALRSGKLEQTRKDALELLDRGTALQKVLNAVLHFVEEENPGMLCAIHLLDSDGERLLPGSAPSLPALYNDDIHGPVIGNETSPCGMAAYTGKRVIVENILSHPYWAPFREFVANAQLVSCWSEPILNSVGQVLGTFAIYHRHPATPGEAEIHLLDSVSGLATLAITRKQNERKLHTSETSLAAAQHLTHIGLWELNSKTNTFKWSDETYRIFGIEPDHRGKPIEFFYDRVHPDDLAAVQKGIKEALDYISPLDIEYRIVLPDGREKAIHALAQIVLDNEDNLVTLRGTMHDITERKEYEKNMVHSAHHDALTGLPNRVLLSNRMQQVLAGAIRENRMLAVCYLDLDNFKPINDTLGHEFGDKVLIQVAGRISQCVRITDTIARLGGDEFVVLLTNLNTLEECNETLQRILESLAQPFWINDERIVLGASIGVSIFPLDNADPDVLLRHADQAMLVAKQTGKNRSRFYDVESEQRLQLHRTLREEIRRGVADNQFELLYQPKVELLTGKLVGAEALIRWRHPSRGLLLPNEFLRVMENTNLEAEIGEWVITAVLHQGHQWHQAGMDLELCINLTAHHLQTPQFVERLHQQMSRYPILPLRRLQIEILETVALEDLAITNTIIESCLGIGVSFALDDFGTGYSSLSYLSKLPVRTLKIDQTFVRDMLEDKDDMAIVLGIIALARGFGRETVAEGIETEEQYQELLRAGCEIGQGYYIARPMQAAELLEWNNERVNITGAVFSTN